MPAKAASLALPLFGPHAPRACLTHSFACSRLGTTPGGSSLSLREARSGWSLHGVRALAPCVRRGAVGGAGCPVVPVNQLSRAIVTNGGSRLQTKLGHQDVDEVGGRGLDDMP